MVVKLRLKRFGRRNHPTYRLCVADSRSPCDGRIVETVGHYLPKCKRADEQLVIDRARVEYWLGVGAQPSETVRSLVRKAGVALPQPRPRKARKRKPKPFTPPRRKRGAAATATAESAG